MVTLEQNVKNGLPFWDEEDNIDFEDSESEDETN
jgi:hypothetical protein